jgi:ubiquinone/menaquinone biosynthesis C-methylase UbiE
MCSKEVKYRILEGKNGIRRTYDDMAGDYDRSKYLYWTRKLEKGEERVVKKWLSKALTPILDVGCGTGRYTLKKAAEGSEVIALDISLKMLKKLIEKAKKHDCYSNVYPVLADGENLPFINDSFNTLICTLTFDHFENCEKAVKEYSRVLKSRGLCILTSFNKYTLDDFKKRANIPLDKIRFQTENMPPTLIYEVGHLIDEIKELFARHEFDAIDVKGCCYWHLLGSEDAAITLARHYPVKLDSFFNLFKPLLKYAEIHAYLFRKH